MIIVKLQGGLGNQMFQYALGRNLSLLRKVPSKIDSSYLRSENQSGRSYRLGGFNVTAKEAAPEEVLAYAGIVPKIFDRFRPDLKRKRVVEKSSVFDEKILRLKNCYLDGHWQNENYFKANERIIRQDFTLKNPRGREAEIMAREISIEPNATSVHIRRGDYVTIKKIADVHGTLPLFYYKAAMKKIIEKFPDAHFFISSDDIAWAKENFPKEYPVTFVSSPKITDCEELTLLSMCKHNIIANSTFSWWGAWLNQNPNKTVIAPKNWFLDSNRSVGGLINQSWIQI